MSANERPILTDEDRAGWRRSEARFSAMSSAIEEVWSPLDERTRVYLCACTRAGEDGHVGCNTLVGHEGGWCANCLNDRECRPELATPRTVAWVCRQLERFVEWARELNYRRRRGRAKFSEDVGVRRWNEEGESWFEITGPYKTRLANDYRKLPTFLFVVVDRDGSPILP